MLVWGIDGELALLIWDKSEKYKEINRKIVGFAIEVVKFIDLTIITGPGNQTLKTIFI